MFCATPGHSQPRTRFRTLNRTVSDMRQRSVIETTRTRRQAFCSSELNRTPMGRMRSGLTF